MASRCAQRPLTRGPVRHTMAVVLALMAVGVVSLQLPAPGRGNPSRAGCVPPTLLRAVLKENRKLRTRVESLTARVDRRGHYAVHGDDDGVQRREATELPDLSSVADLAEEPALNSTVLSTGPRDPFNELRAHLETGLLGAMKSPGSHKVVLLKRGLAKLKRGKCNLKGRFFIHTDCSPGGEVTLLRLGGHIMKRHAKLDISGVVSRVCALPGLKKLYLAGLIGAASEPVNTGSAKVHILDFRRCTELTDLQLLPGVDTLPGSKDQSVALKVLLPQHMMDRFKLLVRGRRDTSLRSVSVNWADMTGVKRFMMTIRGFKEGPFVLPGLDKANCAHVILNVFGRQRPPSIPIRSLPTAAKSLKLRNVAPLGDWSSFSSLKKLDLGLAEEEGGLHNVMWKSMFEGLEHTRISQLLVDIPSPAAPNETVLEFPQSVTNLQKLTVLDWRCNSEGSRWDVELPRSRALARIVLFNLAMTTTPRGLIDLAELTHLDLSHNDLTSVPTELTHCPRLLKVNLADNNVVNMSDEVSKFITHKRITLDLTANPLKLTLMLSKYKDVFALANELVEMDGSLESRFDPHTMECGTRGSLMVTNLLAQDARQPGRMATYSCNDMNVVTVINIDGLYLKTVPKALLGMAPYLSKLVLDSNLISELPSELSESLTSLAHFSMRSNQLTAFPIVNSSKLKYLYLGYNAIEKIPKDIESLHPELKHLSLSSNRITSLPESISELVKLRVLHLDDNHLTHVTADFSRMEHLTVVDFQNNKLTSEALDGFTTNSDEKVQRYVFDSNSGITRYPKISFGTKGKGTIFVISFKRCSLKSIGEDDLRIGKLHPDAKLLFSENKLTSVPPALLRLEASRVLLRKNHIEQVREIDLLFSNIRRELDFSFNRIRNVIPVPLGLNETALADRNTVLTALGSRATRKKANELPFKLRLQYNDIRTLGPTFGYVVEYARMDHVDLNGNPLESWGALGRAESVVFSIADRSLNIVEPRVSSQVLEEILLALRKANFFMPLLAEFPVLEKKIRMLTGARGDEALTFVRYEDESYAMNEHVQFEECGQWTLLCGGKEFGIVTCYCDIGFYRDAHGVCRQCPSGAQCNHDTLNCATSMFTRALPEAPHGFDADHECIMCPEGGVCDGKAVIPSKGYWMMSPTSHEVLSCSNPEACRGGSDSECADGYSGILCGQCTRGYYAGAAHTCLQCPTPLVSIVFFTISCIGIGAASLAFFVMAAGILQQRQSKESRRDARMSSMTSMLRSSQSASAIAHSLKHAIGFLQLVTTLDVTFDLKWPIALDFLDDIFSWVNLDILKATSLECVWELASLDSGGDESVASTVNSSGFGYAQRVVLTGSVPLFVSILLFVLYWAYRVAERVPVVRALARYDIRSLKQLCMQCHLLTWQLCYLPVSFMAIQYFHCRSFDDGHTYYVNNDLETQCYDTQYWSFAGAALGIITVYTIGMPVTIAVYGVWKNKLIHDEHAVGSLVVLYKNYKKEYAYWEAVELLRKVVVGGAVVLLSGSSTFHLTVALVVMFIFTVMHCRCWPNLNKTANIIQATLLFLTYFTMGLGILRTLEVPQTQASVFSVVIVTMDILVVLLIFAILVYDMSEIAREKLAELRRKFYAAHRRKARSV